MANKIQYDATPSLTTIINGTASTPTLKNKANNSQTLSIEIDNASALNETGIFELLCRGASSFTAGGYVELYLIPCADGTNYSDGDDSIAPPATYLAGIFPVRAVSTQQRITLYGVVLPPVKFKGLIVNKTGQSFTNTDGENLLKFGPYNDEVQ